MPQTQSALKALRGNHARRIINDRWRKKVRVALRAVRDAVTAKDKKTAAAAYDKFQSTIDRAARRNIIHPNKVARQKKRLQKTITSL
ncbi:MAG: 30S ribosomal protein S20 [bacterium]